MAPEAAERLRENWERLHRGPDKSSKTAVLTGGLKAHELGSTNTDSQFLEARRFQTEEICRLYRVPPHMIQDLTRATYSNIEQQSIDFLQYSILPWLRRFEKAIARDLIAQPVGYFAAFDTSHLLRGDAAARSAYYSSGLDRGIFSINEVRAMENLNPIDGGDVHYFPLNMTTVEKMAQESLTPSPAGGETAPMSEATQAVESQLNGSQVQSLLQVLANIPTGLLTKDGAVAVVEAAFPQLTHDQVVGIVSGVNLNAQPEPVVNAV